MSDMRISVDDSKLKDYLLFAKREIPTAIRNALNDTLREIQQVERSNITSTFVIRQRQYISSSVKIPREGGFATKEIARGEIGIDTERDVLAKHEEGGDFPSYRGKPRTPIPSREIRSGRGGQVKSGTALKNFLPFAMVTSLNQARFTGSVNLGAFGRRATAVAHRREQLAGQRGSFFVSTRQGDPMLVRRIGKSRQLQGLWIWYPQKRIKPALKFQSTAAAIIPGAWERNMNEAIKHGLLRTATVFENVQSSIGKVF